MSSQTLAAFFGLALALIAQAAFAQSVVVLEIDGDAKGKLRDQVESALKKAKVVDVVALKRFKDAGAKKKLKGSKLMGSAGVAKVASSIGLDAAVGGSVDGSSYSVVIYDAAGGELWSKDLPVKKGLISAKHAQKLAKAIAAAAKVTPKPAAKPDEPVASADEGGGDEKQPADDEPSIPTKPKESEVASTLPEIDLSKESPPLATPEDKERRRLEEMAEAHTTTEPSEPVEGIEFERPKAKPAVGPKLITLIPGGSFTWRAYCSRPGVASCAAYDKLPDPKPSGDTVSFFPQFPYAGFSIGADLFPLAGMNNLSRGLGLVGNYSQGFSLTLVSIANAQGGETPERQVYSVDREYSLMATYRYYFGLGLTDSKNPLPSYVGFRGGVAGRVFEVDPGAQVPLPGSSRAYPALGLDVSIPIIKYVRVEGSGLYFVNPKAGADEIAGYGNPSHPTGGATGSGFGLEAGVAGDLWGPIGYVAKFRLSSYVDQFFGQGDKWVDCNDTDLCGTAEEVYRTAQIGLTVGF